MDTKEERDKRKAVIFDCVIRLQDERRRHESEMESMFYPLIDVFPHLSKKDCEGFVVHNPTQKDTAFKEIKTCIEKVKALQELRKIEEKILDLQKEKAEFVWSAV